MRRFFRKNMINLIYLSLHSANINFSHISDLVKTVTVFWHAVYTLKFIYQANIYLTNEQARVQVEISSVERIVGLHT